MPGEAPLMLCYDGSKDAKHAIGRAGELFAGRNALVLTVWQSTAVVANFAWSAPMTPMLDYADLDRASAEVAGQRAEEGLGIAQDAGLKAEQLVVMAPGPIWKTIIETADQRGAVVIVMGSRGLSKVESMLLGSVSGHVVHHADRAAMVIPFDAIGRTPAEPNDSAQEVRPTPADVSETRWPHSHLEAAVEEIVTTLRSNGVLTRARLVELCGASHWNEPFTPALALAVSSGRVRLLGDELYEAIDP